MYLITKWTAKCKLDCYKVSKPLMIYFWSRVAHQWSLFIPCLESSGLYHVSKTHPTWLPADTALRYNLSFTTLLFFLSLSFISFDSV